MYQYRRNVLTCFIISYSKNEKYIIISMRGASNVFDKFNIPFLVKILNQTEINAYSLNMIK